MRRVVGVALAVVGLGALVACASAPPPPPGPAPAEAWTELKLSECRAGRDDLCLYLAEGWPYAEGAQRGRMEAGLTIACERGNARGCRMLGQMLAATSSVASARALARACAVGEVVECTQQVLTHGLPQRAATYDPERAVAAAEAGCAHGDPQLCGWVLRLAQQDDVAPAPGRVDRALAGLHCGGRPAGDLACRRQVGLAYAGELQAPQGIVDLARARALFREGCEAGDMVACHLQARLLYRGEGGPVDRAGASQLLEESCAGGVVQACLLRGRVALVRGKGYDPAAAVRWFERACGPARGCLYEAGLRLAYKAEWGHAERVLGRACEAGEAPACGALGRVLVLTRRRPAEALDLLDRACTQQDEAACLAAAHLSSRPGRLRDPARAARYRRMAVARDPAREPLGTTMKRALRGEGSKGDEWLTAAVIAGTALLPVWPLVYLAHDRSRGDGFGFEHLAFPDP